MQLNKSAPSPATSFSFEQILGWFGRFTPQFKFHLMGLHRKTSPSEFDLAIKEAMTAFRTYLSFFGKFSKGAERARAVHQLLEQEAKDSPVVGATCAAGCSACCHFPKQITSDEGDLLIEVIRDLRLNISKDYLARQKVNDAKASACVFLNDKKMCGVYEARPAACRKYFVFTPKENCESQTTRVIPYIDPMPEIITSAALSLPDNPFDFMADVLLEKLDEVGV
jgi:Fe-S-cluster containining protein